MARRNYSVPHGQGSFYQRESDSRWVGVLEAGWTERGTRRRITVSSLDKDEAWDKLTAARKRLQLGDVAQNVPTVKAWSETWLESIRGHVRPSSLDMYRSRAKAWIVPTLGTKRLDRLTPADLRALQASMDAADRAQDTKRAVHSCLMTMLTAAVVEGHPVPRPVLAVRKPPAALETRTMIPLDDALRLVAVASQLPDGARWVAALLQGMRQAECLGLTWAAVDWDERTIDVSWQLVELTYSDRKTKTFRVPPGYEVRQLSGAQHLARPKSRAGRRIVPLVPWMHEALLRWRDEAPANPHDLIWPTPDGRPQRADDDRAAWYALLDAAKVTKPDGSRYVLHEARHTAASLLLAAGVDEEVVRTIMGWSSVAMKRTYSHASPELVRDALARSASQLQLGAGR